jgi:hypothetical protein
MTADDEAALDVERLAGGAADEPAALEGLLSAVGPERVAQPIREASAAALKLLATRRPELLMPHWDELAALLDCDNAYSRMIAVHVLALLAPADDEGRLAASLDRLYDHLGDMVSVAGHVLQVAPQIARARPELRHRVTARILDLERLAKPDRLGLLRSYAIEALDGYLEPGERTPEIMAFVAAGVSDDSPKTRKLAAEVLERWEPAPGAARS